MTICNIFSIFIFIGKVSKPIQSGSFCSISIWWDIHPLVQGSWTCQDDTTPVPGFCHTRWWEIWICLIFLSWWLMGSFTVYSFSGKQAVALCRSKIKRMSEELERCWMASRHFLLSIFISNKIKSIPFCLCSVSK